jgi:hypothetical protein
MYAEHITIRTDNTVETIRPAVFSGPVVVEAAGFEPASANAPSARFYERRIRFSFALSYGPGHRRKASPLNVP